MFSRCIVSALHPRMLPGLAFGRMSAAGTTSIHAPAVANRAFSSSSNDAGADPLGTINNATDAIRSFTSRLKDLSATITQDVKLASGQSVTLRAIVLHSRDSSPSDFASSAAISARKDIEPLASQVEEEMSNMAQVFMADVAPMMAKAASICEETHCGGIMWELEDEGKFDQSIEVERSGSDTPCGRLEAASQEFVELTHTSREDVALGARAALLIRMAHEHNAPLVEVRKTQEGKDAMAKRFREEMIPTPWIRPKEEFGQLKRMREE
mmetsp:Transcript_19566/g.32357  ORF Transcript_19566/g.32357 Transcript_19566/m.32357 type:complete len:268 (-) Transcript_19566:26-829(-)